jgi:cytochrome oxidase assembly protein ShyY1
MRRKLFFALIFSAGALGCTNAGFWQLRRKRWKESLISSRSQFLDQSPLPVSLPLPPVELSFRPVRLTGHFDHKKEMLLLRRYGERTGYRVITPFFLSPSQGFLVNRGWIPTNFKALSTRNETFEQVEISGVMREGEKASKYMPENSPRLNEWYFVELEMMSKFAGLENEEARKWFVHEVDWEREREVYEEEDYPEMPVRSVKKEMMSWTIMPEGHATYSAFWFMTAGICMAFNVFVLKRY